MTTGERIKKRRETMGLSQQELADLMMLKSKASISKIESSKNQVSLKHIIKIAELLNCSPSDLIGDQTLNAQISPNDYNESDEILVELLIESIKVQQCSTRIETTMNKCMGLKIEKDDSDIGAVFEFPFLVTEYIYTHLKLTNKIYRFIQDQYKSLHDKSPEQITKFTQKVKVWLLKLPREEFIKIINKAEI